MKSQRRYIPIFNILKIMGVNNMVWLKQNIFSSMIAQRIAPSKADQKQQKNDPDFICHN